MVDKKKIVPFIIIGLLGAFVSAGSFMLLRNQHVVTVETKEMIVLSRDVSMYEVIQPNHISRVAVPATTNTDLYINALEDILGKIAIAPMSADNPVMPSQVLPKDEIGNIVFMTLQMPYAQTGGARAGDIVDIYRVQVENDGWVEGSKTLLMSKDARVVSLSDKDGLVTEPNRINSPVIQVVRVGVNPDDVRRLAPASAIERNNYVLVVRNAGNNREKVDALVYPSKKTVPENEPGEQSEGGE